MARPERNTIDYFPHILGEGKKMYFIETKYGNDGYATWYKILEKLGSTDHHYLNLNKVEEVMFLAAKCRVSEEMLILIITDLTKIGVFDAELWDNKIIWCPQFIETIQDAYKKRNNKCITLEGLRVLLDGLGILKLDKSISKGGINTQSKVKYSKENNTKEKERDFIDPLFLPVFMDWINYKRQRKESYKAEASEKAFYNLLLKLSNNNPVTAKAIVETSMANNWAGIFELKEKPVNDPNKPKMVY